MEKEDSSKQQRFEELVKLYHKQKACLPPEGFGIREGLVKAIETMKEEGLYEYFLALSNDDLFTTGESGKPIIPKMGRNPLLSN